MLCEILTGQPGRPSKALTLEQAEAVLTAAEVSPLCAYIVLSLLLGARTKELRALTWDHVDLVGQPDAQPEVLPSIAVWRSARAGGDTKTRKSRRMLALPTRCVTALQTHRVDQDAARKRAGQKWQEHNLVFASTAGTELDAHNVRRAFRKVVEAAGLIPEEWTPREIATQLRVPALRLRRSPRRHRPTRRPQRHSSHRNSLPQTDPTSDGTMRYRNEPNLPYPQLNPYPW